MRRVQSPATFRLTPGARRAKLLCATAVLLTPLAVLAQGPSAENAAADAAAEVAEVAEAAPAVVNVVGKAENKHSFAARSASVFRGAEDLRDIPQPVTVLTREFLDARKLLDLHDVLQNTPGVTVDYVDSERVTYFSRGYQIDALQIDGLTISQSGSAFVQPDTAVLEQVEVLRGASGMLRGAGNPSATVNMVRKRPTRAFQASGALTLGSWDRRRVEADISSPLNASGSVRGRVVAVKDKKEFFQDAKQEDREVLYGVVEADLGERTTLTGSLQYTGLDATGAWGGMPGNFDGTPLNLPRSTYLGSDWNKWNRSNEQALLALEHRFDNDWTMKASAAYTHLDLTDFKQTYMARPAGATNPYLMTVTTAEYIGNESRQAAMTVIANGPFTLFGRKHELTVGAERMRVDAVESWGAGNLYPVTVDIRDWNPATSYLERDVTLPTTPTRPNITTQQGAFGTFKLSLLDSLQGLVGARLSWWEYDSHGSPTSSYKVTREVTPFFGLVYDVSKNVSAYASYTEIFTPQNVRDAQGEILDPIRGEDYELGLKGAFFGGALNASAGLFRIENVGRAVEDTSSINPCLPYFTSGYCRVAGGKQRSEGWEAELSGEVLPGLQVFGGYTNTRTRYVVDTAANTGQPLRSIDPKHQLRVFATYKLDAFAPGLSVGGGVQAQSDAFVRSGAITTRQGGYTIANAMLSYRFNEKLALQVNANNLFDKVYYKKFAPTGIGYYYGDPRNVSVTLRGTL
ncbi:TonB-dependent siderophore receptor [Massilia sp. YIM B02769]|uniref:TonB-dependent siderophore receptor n=1 Tax=Massilia sp. YIM B02769 TaxID=3050129 RepID=UPI0025B7286B|nr:TonB-dependent siderophore receptor [Massilia sp. YIM B02769]MDN4059725.1 TonB-dependent siderophore receptor [Massilia sp. YIM B02769]